jgi:hypothetical protein
MPPWASNLHVLPCIEAGSADGIEKKGEETRREFSKNDVSLYSSFQSSSLSAMPRSKELTRYMYLLLHLSIWSALSISSLFADV